MSETIVDSRGQQCPLPVLKLRKALLAVPAGVRVRLWATDAQARRDVPNFCAETGDRLIAQHEADGVLVFLVERGPAATA